MNNLPIARSTDIVHQFLDKEVLIYDLKAHKAYNLNETSTIIYHSCNGKTSFEELKNKYQFTDDLIFLALEDLRKADLLEESEILSKSPFAGMSRRDVIKKVALGTMIAMPVISSLIVPTAARASSVCTDTGSCICVLPTSSSDTTCSSPDCSEPSCLCIVSRTGCSDNGDGTESCFGNCNGIT